MNKLLLIALLSALSCSTNFAQSEENNVREVINKMFNGMKLGDSAMVRSVFHKQVTMATSYRSPNNNPMLRRESSINDFLKAVGAPHPEQWNEEIWNVVIHMSDDLAMVWCDYAFYVGKKFSHCGIDAFQLHKGTEGWKIFHLADTRRSANCDIPKEIADKYSN